MVSGLGISSESDGSVVRDPAAASEPRPDPVSEPAPWERPPPSKKELWRKRHGLDEQGKQDHG